MADADPYLIEFLEVQGDAGSVCPVKDFLDGVSPKMRARILRTIDLLEKNGSQLTGPHSKHLEDGIFELRTQQGNQISRVLYFFIVGRKAVLTHGFIKKTQKTPPAEIKKAEQYRERYLKAIKNNRE